MSDDLEALIDHCGGKAKDIYGGDLPDKVVVVFRRFGLHGGRWEARGPVSTAYCGKDELEAFRQAWWMVWCDDEYIRRQEAAAT